MKTFHALSRAAVSEASGPAASMRQSSRVASSSFQRGRFRAEFDQGDHNRSRTGRKAVSTDGSRNRLRCSAGGRFSRWLTLFGATVRQRAVRGRSIRSTAAKQNPWHCVASAVVRYDTIRRRPTACPRWFLSMDRHNGDGPAFAACYRASLVIVVGGLNGAPSRNRRPPLQTSGCKRRGRVRFTRCFPRYYSD